MHKCPQVQLFLSGRFDFLKDIFTNILNDLINTIKLYNKITFLIKISCICYLTDKEFS